MNLVDHKMRKNNVPVLSHADIETIADDVIRSFLAHATADSPAINIELLAEKHLGVRLDYVHLSNNESILGMMIFQDCSVPLYLPDDRTAKYYAAKAGTAMIDRSLLNDRKMGRARFTIAHECAHWILHRPTKHTYVNQITLDIPAAIDDPNVAIVCRTASSRAVSSGLKTPGEWKEWQADNLASALLMPAGAVRTCMMNCISQMNGSANIHFDLYGEKYVQAKTASLIRHMAALFQVSEKAAEIRLNRLGYLCQRPEEPKQVPLEFTYTNPYDLFDW